MMSAGFRARLAATMPARAQFPVVLALLVSLAALGLSWHLPLLEMHSFRQTQTAISSYWLASSPHWLAYPTPVLGAPWSLPFEFPLFQWIVAVAAQVLPVNLDQAGRGVSWLFALACLWPLSSIARASRGGESLPVSVCVLFLVSPLYLFWSRAVLIESCALFFSLGFVALIGAWLRQPRWRIAFALFACAVLAALVKITTFVGFSAAGAALVLAHAWNSRGSWRNRDALRRYSVPLAAVLVAVLVTKAWLLFADAQKAQTIWGAALGSANLDAWNFGTLAQRLDPALWRDVVFGRAARDSLGAAWLAPVALVIALAFGRGVRALALVLAALYLLPFLVFTNLHFVHNYYQYANAVFLVALAALAVEALGIAFGTLARHLALACFAIAMLLGFRRDFLPAILGPLPGTPTLALARDLRAVTPPDSVILGFGLDWSAEVPYYAERRALLLPDWVGGDVLHRLRADPDGFRGGFPLGAVVDCPNHLGDQPATAADYHAVMAEVTRGRIRHEVEGCAVWR